MQKGQDANPLTELFFASIAVVLVGRTIDRIWVFPIRAAAKPDVINAMELVIRKNGKFSGS